MFKHVNRQNYVEQPKAEPERLLLQIGLLKRIAKRDKPSKRIMLQFQSELESQRIAGDPLLAKAGEEREDYLRDRFWSSSPD